MSSKWRKSFRARKGSLWSSISLKSSLGARPSVSAFFGHAKAEGEGAVLQFAAEEFGQSAFDGTQVAHHVFGVDIHANDRAAFEVGHHDFHAFREGGVGLGQTLGEAHPAETDVGFAHGFVAVVGSGSGGRRIVRGRRSGSRLGSLAQTHGARSGRLGRRGGLGSHASGGFLGGTGRSGGRGLIGLIGS